LFFVRQKPFCSRKKPWENLLRKSLFPSRPVGCKQEKALGKPFFLMKESLGKENLFSREAFFAKLFASPNASKNPLNAFN